MYLKSFSQEYIISILPGEIYTLKDIKCACLRVPRQQLGKVPFSTMFTESVKLKPAVFILWGQWNMGLGSITWITGHMVLLICLKQDVWEYMPNVHVVYLDFGWQQHFKAARVEYLKGKKSSFGDVFYKGGSGRVLLHDWLTVTHIYISSQRINYIHKQQ